MTKLITAIILATGIFGLSACTGVQEVAVVSSKTPTSQAQPTSTPKATYSPMLEGKSPEAYMNSYGVFLSNAYQKQVCSYVKSYVADGYMSSSEIQAVVIDMSTDTRYAYRNNQLAVAFVGSVAQHCPEYINIIKASN